MYKLSTFPTLLTAVVLSVLPTRPMFGQQSDVSSRLFETTTATNSAALAIGSGATADISGISIANSKFSGTAISTTTAVNSAALAIGSGAFARLRGIYSAGHLVRTEFTRWLVEVLDVLDSSFSQLCHEGNRIDGVSQEVDASLDISTLQNEAGGGGQHKPVDPIVTLVPIDDLDV